jgi:PBSX family phage portal protein
MVYCIEEPIYTFNRLINIYAQSSILSPCVESMAINIEGYGHIWEYIGPKGKQESVAALKEMKMLESVVTGFSQSRSLVETRKQSRSDYEILGGRAFEVARNRKGQVVLFDHVPMFTLRMTRVDPTPAYVRVTQVDANGDPFVRTVPRYFRRYVQISPGTLERVYFKEFGDPRTIDPKTGEVNPDLPFEEQATEIYMDAQYMPGHLYGVPKWVGILPAILGSREAEEVNLNFFRENAIPAMAVLVSGGNLTQESFAALEESIVSRRGQGSMNRVLVIEALADDQAGGLDHSQPAPRIDMRPMISERQQEGLFQEYDSKNAEKGRSVFRLPPISQGRAQDYTRASAIASMQVAENQVYLPERMRFDEFLNTKIFSTYSPKYWRFKSLGAPLSDPESIATIVDSLGGQGALTPNVVIGLANQILAIDVPSISEDWGNAPFAVILEMVKKGTVIKGLDTFIQQMAAAAEAPTLPGKPLAKEAAELLSSYAAGLSAAA